MTVASSDGDVSMTNAESDIDAAKEAAAPVDDVMDEEEQALASKVKEWVKGELDKEVARVEACGQKILRLAVKNCSVVRPDKNSVINRVEIDTTFDFDAVQQIMLSDAMPCPLEEKKGFSLRFVVLSTGKPIVMILPYLYDTSMAGNSLREWSLINNKLKSSRHRVDFDDDGDAAGENALETIAEEDPKPKGRRQPARPSRKRR
eukprot:TRINITY_DN15007_c0_g1_i1.p1 TRINITY_DN15007_c0_g1~~TRINITY_DN15007_c0_g1_i1.p1  ORF type:complete len:204 (+),score=50.84 TRINITY_DN15007_c0_g1_i1:57-668(+)